MASDKKSRCPWEPQLTPLEELGVRGLLPVDPPLELGDFGLVPRSERKSVDRARSGCNRQMNSHSSP